MRANKILLGVIAVGAIAALIVVPLHYDSVPQPTSSIAAQMPSFHGAATASQGVRPGDFPSLSGATEWLNSPPLTPAGLRGKVVLVDVWTYTCINWLRTLPYVRAWAEKYKNQGLVVIGVRSPEFEFEINIDNIRRAVKAMRIDYPVA